MRDGYVQGRRSLQTLFMSTVSKRLKTISHRKKYLQMELVILLAKDATIFSDTIENIKKKLTDNYSDSEIEECLYDLYIDLEAEQRTFNTRINLYKRYD